MNVVFISAQPYPYGMAGSKRIRLFAEYLAKTHAVKVIVAGPDNGKNPAEGSENNVIYKFHKFSRLQSVTGISKARKIVRENFTAGKKNVLLLYDGIGLTNMRFAKQGRKMGYRIVTDVVEDYTLHRENAGFLLSMLHRINAHLEKRTNKMVDGVIVLSTRLQNKFKKLQVPADKIVLVPVSAENAGNEIQPVRPANEFTFAYSGSYGNKDGVDVLVKAFKQLAKKKKTARLVLAGKINQRISGLIANEEAIRYAGMIPDESYYDFLNAANALLMTRINSEYANAGFPFKLGEYLATGRPVIASKVSDVELYLNDNEDALLVEGSSVSSLLSAMEFAVSNPDSLGTIGRNGKKKCLQFFDPEKNGKQLEDFLEKI